MHKLTKHILAILIIIYFSLPNSIAQHPELRFNLLNMDDGLSSTQELFIVQDSIGFIWIGSSNGLNRYDGYTFKVYQHNNKDSTSIASNDIFRLFVDSKNRLWIGTVDRGYALYNRQNDNFTNFRFHDKHKKLHLSSVNAFAEDSYGTIWIAASENLTSFDSNGKTTNYFPEPGNPNSPLEKGVKNIVSDRNGVLWLIYNDSGFSKFEVKEKRFTHYPYKPNSKHSLNDDETYHAILHNNSLWFATEAGGLNKFHIPTQTFEYIYPLQSFDFKYLAIEDKNHLWIASQNKGLIYYNIQTQNAINYLPDKNNPYSISSKIVSKILKDRQGNLWLRAGSKGINVSIKKKNFNNLRKGNRKTNLTDNDVTAILCDSRGQLWTGFNTGGINVFDTTGNRIHEFYFQKNNTRSLGYATVFQIFEDAEQNIWVSTYAKRGLQKYIPATHNFKSYMHNPQDTNSVAGNDIRDIAQDRSGNLWLAIHGGGLDKFNPKTETFTHYRHDKQDSSTLATDWLWTIFCDSKDNIWIGSLAGLSKLNPDKKSFRNYTTLNSNLNNRHVMVITEDNEGSIWLGTREGIHLFNEEKNSFISYDKNDGLPNSRIHGIVTDKNNNLWISTLKGISKFNAETRNFKNYDASDGLQGNEFSRGACIKDNNGRLYFGGNNGLTMFYPDSIFGNRDKPPVVFTNFKLFNHSVPIMHPDTTNADLNGFYLPRTINYLDTIVLHYYQNIITVEYTALNYIQSSKNQYAYKMHGFDKDWHYVGSERKATYTNLSPGEYRFQVRASNNDGIWNNTGKQVYLIIKPPFWMTWWFRSLVIGFIVISAFLFYRRRVKRLTRQKRELEKRVKERTYDLQEANLILEERQEEILQQNEEIQVQNDELEEANQLLEQQKKALKQKNDEVVESYKNAKVLSDFGQRLTATLQLETISKLLYEQVDAMMSISALGIGVYTKGNNAITYLHFIYQGKKQPVFKKSLDKKNSLTVYCFKNQKPVIIHDLKNDYKKYIDKMPDISTENPPRSILHFPLTVEKNKIGVLAVNSIHPNAFTEQHYTNLQTIASYLAIALDNAQAYRTINAKNQKIQASISYAKTIQQAVLPRLDEIAKKHPIFLIFRPKDVVSGDFFWHTTVDNYLFFAVVDCTGHGVPGAFMSMIGIRLLDEIIKQNKITEPVTILNKLENLVQISLKQKITDNAEGMDVCLLRISESNANNERKIVFAGAKRPVIYFEKNRNKIHLIRGARRGIGGIYSYKVGFHQDEFILQNGDIAYLTSDGFTDQHNTYRKRFGKKQLIETLEEIANLPMNEQAAFLENKLDNYMKNCEQRDDITVLGVQL